MNEDFGETCRPPHTAPAKPGGAETQDVFLLTGTTFAGTTDMNSTAGPSDTRPSTQAGALDTRPGSVLPISEIGEDGGGDSISSTARHQRLLIEAELRAEHQAAARNTMLDLAQALEQSNCKARELADRLRRQSDASEDLQAEIERLRAEVEWRDEEEEKRQAAVLTEKALKSGNKMVFGMLLEKSKDAYDFSLFDNGTKKDGRPNTPAVPDGLSLSGQPREVLEVTGPDGAVGMDLGDALGGAVGDRVTASWCVKLWRREVELENERKAKEREEEEARRKAEEDARRIQEAKEKAVEEVRKMVRELESQLERARALVEEQGKKQEKLERELRETKEAAHREASASKAREEKLKEELEETKIALHETRTSLSQLREDYAASEEALRKADEAFSHERASLQSVIRQVSSELHQAMVLAKHLRETALKAKRDAAGSVSPSKFAELIAQLEEMKNQLSVIAKDYANEKEDKDRLRMQFDKNRRQLELERQFLPLLRKVRGPVGPKVKGEKDDATKRLKDATHNGTQASPNMMPALANGTSPKLRQTQSMSALDNTRAATAGGPLPGGRAGGFQEDQSRFASSMGFASSNGQGTPLRG